MEDKMVCVVMITYGQEKYIAQAIESVLMQQCEFPFELFISNDHSPDKTDDIVQDFIKNHPKKNIIRYFNQSDNIGAMQNFLFAIKQPKSKYTALCDGDDYWTDEKKLQKQIDFLESNNEYSICFHRVHEKINGHLILSSINDSDTEKTYSIEDLAKTNFIHTPSVVFRNGLIEKFPSWFLKSPVADYILHMLNAKHGLIKYFPDPMAVYRVNSGVWSGQAREKMVYKWMNVLNLLMNENFDSHILELLKKQWRNVANEYLFILYTTNTTKFFEEIKSLAKEDPVLSYEWATVHYPYRIKNILNSQTFIYLERIANCKRIARNFLKFRRSEG